jgi:oligopeptide transport system ATP-binding protein
MCDRIAVMYAGKVVEAGNTDDIFYHPSHEYTKGLLLSLPNLNDTERKKLIPIDGQPVDMLNPPVGCPFAPRCHSCMKVCLRSMPEFTDLGEEHYSACWLLDKAKFDKGEVQA